MTTRKPSFTPEATFELGYGNEDFVQAKGSFSGPLGEKLAGRISFSSTQRGGNVYNVRTNEWINTLDNQGIRAQLSFTPSDKVDVTASIDYHFGSQGLVERLYAAERGRDVGGRSEPTPWEARVGSWGERGGARVPLAGEVVS